MKASRKAGIWMVLGSGLVAIIVYRPTLAVVAVPYVLPAVLVAAAIFGVAFIIVNED